MKFVVALTLLLAQSFAFAQTPPPSTLARVTQSGILRVCTPGDYKPFSFQRAPGEFEGLDVDLMGSLATALNAKPQFVKTTWANLLPDFVAGKCDIAAGGISVSLERQKQAYFSTPYMVNGKTPLTRCENVAKYQSIEAIDQPSVRVIANPGGSNEKFARTKLSHAQLTMHSDNLTIFDEIIKGHADVFVTEAAEAIVQSKAHPELCAVNPDKPLQYAEMGYLLPNGDDVFKHFVDQWLHLSQANGEYAQMSAKWLGK
ncbi:Cyclohexadienyl dehydratase [Paraburkholderia nemoris]|jgi:cyclohexadienyl dehydratase|uniref:transporter substrate-binding domain-containing protein n=1 Tax=Paraburkholderia TaxID=1822464 RepID=UPI001909C330|nr:MULTISPECIES: transporter substrate-binding domain-containing protein [Paraburkholderia]MBK3738919.1 transporter substrate-binding domain-containing protein [Paraburkholderia aspalathi]MBK3785502.1 transporter substrate-binding domain-containing protein [Paraburkholderia aspalathi]MCX4138874.1 transporter substrate-binding domain-containing protein [Paraburkholderia aspalathi]MDN7171564.1 transporter substrate-binding domain-containing protein [Paraburkholderia sp. SEWSISQ10-3 4]MDQ6501203.